MLGVMSPGELEKEEQRRRGRMPGRDVPADNLRIAGDAQAMGCSDPGLSAAWAAGLEG